MLQGSYGGNLGWKKFFVFFVLYFVQGIPYGFQTRYLPILFRINGMDLAQVGMFKLLMMPWLLKPLWALLVDNYFTRKFWLNSSLISLCLLCIMTSFVPPSFGLFFSVLMLSFNIVTSVQDIALDSVVIDSLTPLQLAQGNIAQVVGYKSGGLFSGGVFTMLSDIISWREVFFTLATIYVIGFFFSALFLEEDVDVPTESSSSGSRSRHNMDTLREGEINNSGVGSGISCYLSALTKAEGTIWMVIFALFYKVGEMGASNIYPMFMLDNGIKPRVTGFWTGFVGQGFSVLGSVIGGLLDSRQLFYNLTMNILVRGISVLAMFLCVFFWDSFTTMSYVFSVIGLQGVFLTGGAITTITYTLAMTLSQRASKRCRASHYTILTTTDILGRLMFAPINGGVTDMFGYPWAFALFTLTSFLTLFQLSFSPEIIKRH